MPIYIEKNINVKYPTSNKIIIVVESGAKGFAVITTSNGYYPRNIAVNKQGAKIIIEGLQDFLLDNENNQEEEPIRGNK